MVKKNLKPIIEYLSSPINLQNDRQQILYLLEIADFSLGSNLFVKAVISQIQFTKYIPALSWEKAMYGYPERKGVD